MKKGMFATIMVSALLLALAACTKEEAETQGRETAEAQPKEVSDVKPGEAEGKVELKTETDKLSYFLGYGTGKNLEYFSGRIDEGILKKALSDALNGREAVLAEADRERIQTALMEEQKKRQEELREKNLRERKIQAEKNLKEAETFLAENAKKEGIVVLENGLQYKVLKEGTGKKAKMGDRVRMHYRGVLLDDTEFDGTYEEDAPTDENEPTTFTLAPGRLIQGWLEAVPLMNEGAKWRLFVPPALAYSERGFRKIPPNAALIFDLELVEVLGPPKPGEAGPAQDQEIDQEMVKRLLPQLIQRGLQNR